MEENAGLSSLGGSCWFGVELKTFEILLEIVKGKEVGKIVERGRGFSSWIRFGERSLVGLLEGWKIAIMGSLVILSEGCGRKEEGSTN